MIILFARCHSNKGTLVIPCPVEIALRPHKMQLPRWMAPQPHFWFESDGLDGVLRPSGAEWHKFLDSPPPWRKRPPKDRNMGYQRLPTKQPWSCPTYLMDPPRVCETYLGLQMNWIKSLDTWNMQPTQAISQLVNNPPAPRHPSHQKCLHFLLGHEKSLHWIIGIAKVTITGPNPGEWATPGYGGS